MVKPREWRDEDWQALVLAIRYRQCTPFLGAGASRSVLPSAKELAAEWAAHCAYPFDDTENLPRVAQYMAVKRLAPKLQLKGKFEMSIEDNGTPDFENTTEIHRFVADLNLPLYITTNYDDFMFRALSRNDPTNKRYPCKSPISKSCEWYRVGLSDDQQQGFKRDRAIPEHVLEKPTPQEPLVYHLHGTLGDPNSMVLTEDDYLEFLIALTEEPALIPAQVREAFSGSAFLFLGYSLNDLNFKVLFRKMARYMRGTRDAPHVAVQLLPELGKKNAEGEPIVPEPSAAEVELVHRQIEYYERQFDLQRVSVYWGSCEQFASDLTIHM